MIKHLTVRNFQNHSAFDQELSPGVNVFVGRSGAGKSAGVVRPLRLLAFNRPLGESYRKWDSDETSVTVELGSGVEVSRIKSDKENLYWIADSETEVFRSFGQQPPEAVAEVLNLGEINFQFQHDPMFLLSMSPAELARTLNEVAGLDQIDEAFIRINSRLRRERAEVSAAESLRDHLKADLDKYKELEELEINVQLMEELESRQVAQEGKAVKLNSLAEKWDASGSEFHKYDDLWSVVKTCQEADQSMIDIMTLKARYDYLNDLADRWGESVKSIDTFEQLIDLDLSTMSLIAIVRDTQTREKEWRELAALADKIERAERLLRQAELDLLKGREEFEKLMPETCPLCGAKR